MVPWYWLIVAFFAGSLVVLLPLFFMFLEARDMAKAIDDSYAGLGDKLASQNESMED